MVAAIQDVLLSSTLVAAVGVGTLGTDFQTEGHANTLQLDRRAKSSCQRVEQKTSNEKRTILIVRRAQTEERSYLCLTFIDCIITLQFIPSFCTGHLLPRFVLPGSISGCQRE